MNLILEIIEQQELQMITQKFFDHHLSLVITINKIFFFLIFIFKTKIDDNNEKDCLIKVAYLDQINNNPESIYYDATIFEVKKK